MIIMTKIITKDNRKITNPTFADIKEGVMFTEVDCEEIFIKTAVLKNEEYSTTTNAIDLEGDTHWFDDDEEVWFIREIEVTIKQ